MVTERQHLPEAPETDLRRFNEAVTRWSRKDLAESTGHDLRDVALQ